MAYSFKKMNWTSKAIVYALECYAFDDDMISALCDLHFSTVQDILQDTAQAATHCETSALMTDDDVVRSTDKFFCSFCDTDKCIAFGSFKFYFFSAKSVFSFHFFCSVCISDQQFNSSPLKKILVLVLVLDRIYFVSFESM